MQHNDPVTTETSLVEKVSKRRSMFLRSGEELSSGHGKRKEILRPGLSVKSGILAGWGWIEDEDEDMADADEE